MLKTRIISGCQYTYEESLFLVTVDSLLHKPDKSCYYANGLFSKSLISVRTSVRICRLEMSSIVLKLCPGARYYHKNDVSQKESGLYDSKGKRIIYKVGSLYFRYIWHLGHIKSMDEEINFMLGCGVSHAESLLELLHRKNVVKKLHLLKTTRGLPRCHYPLLHDDLEHEPLEMEYWRGRSDVLLSKVELPRYYDN